MNVVASDLGDYIGVCFRGFAIFPTMSRSAVLLLPRIASPNRPKFVNSVTRSKCQKSGGRGEKESGIRAILSSRMRKSIIHLLAAPLIIKC